MQMHTQLKVKGERCGYFQPETRTKGVRGGDLFGKHLPMTPGKQTDDSPQSQRQPDSSQTHIPHTHTQTHRNQRLYEYKQFTPSTNYPHTNFFPLFLSQRHAHTLRNAVVSRKREIERGRRSGCHPIINALGHLLHFL